MDMKERTEKRPHPGSIPMVLLDLNDNLIDRFPSGNTLMKASGIKVIRRREGEVDTHTVYKKMYRVMTQAHYDTLIEETVALLTEDFVDDFTEDLFLNMETDEHL